MIFRSAAHDAVVSDWSGSQVWGTEGSHGDASILVQCRNQQTSFAFRNNAGILVTVFSIDGCAQSQGASELVIALPTVVEQMFGI